MLLRENSIHHRPWRIPDRELPLQHVPENQRRAIRHLDRGAPGVIEVSSGQPQSIKFIGQGQATVLF
jgi:hypothetical protein